MDLPYYFKLAIDKKASDLHLIEGSVPALRVSGELIKVGDKPIPYGELRYSFFQVVDKDVRELFERKKDIDLSLEFFNNRFRVNVHLQNNHLGLAARLIPRFVPTAEEISLSQNICNLTHLQDGLVLITGPSGAGKSTTLATMIDIINAERKAHIITIENPIEYRFQDKQSIIEQRELGIDTDSFADALKSALRQDPNVIMVGEMRDLETVKAALMAARTGHLVLSTLHTTTAAETVERIMDFYPIQNQFEIVHQLSGVLRAVVSQQLLPKIEGGLVAARELMINNRAINTLIKNRELDQINNVIQTSRKDGMISMNRAIEELYAQGIINRATVRRSLRDEGTKAVYK